MGYKAGVIANGKTLVLGLCGCIKLLICAREERKKEYEQGRGKNEGGGECKKENMVRPPPLSRSGPCY